MSELPISRTGGAVFTKEGVCSPYGLVIGQNIKAAYFTLEGPAKYRKYRGSLDGNVYYKFLDCVTQKPKTVRFYATTKWTEGTEGTDRWVVTIDHPSIACLECLLGVLKDITLLKDFFHQFYKYHCVPSPLDPAPIRQCEDSDRPFGPKKMYPPGFAALSCAAQW